MVTPPRYGGYLVMTLTVAGGQESQARAFVERLAPNARLTYSVGGTLKFELPSDEVCALWGTPAPPGSRASTRTCRGDATAPPHTTPGGAV
jgi:hypothetical protein